MKRLTKRGFTLIELMIVIVVLAILALIAVPSFLADINNSKTAVAKESAAAIGRDAIAMSESSWNGQATGWTNPYAFVPAATDEAGGGVSVTDTANGFTVTGGSGGSACLVITAAPTGGATGTPGSASETVTSGACA